MNSPLFNEWIEEQRNEATIEANKQTTRKHIIDLLIEKFDFVSKALRDSIDSIDDIVVLEELFKKVIKIETLEDLKLLLEKAKNI